MTSHDMGLPRPALNADNAPFINAWREGRLAFQRCADCQRPVFYPRPMCPNCWSDDLVWEEASGEGTVVSYSIVRKAGNAALQAQVPIVVAEIRLKEGFPMIARVICDSVDSVRSGMAVGLVDSSQAVHYALPTFLLSQSPKN